MTKDGSRKRVSDLRKQAEKILSGKPVDFQTLTPTDVQQLLHELSVHQIELEMQNEELRNVQLELLEARDKYLNLYDFAPTGYFTLDRSSLIVEVNIIGSQLMASEKHNLIGTQFTALISSESQDEFYLHYREALKTGVKDSCELKMLKADGTPFRAQLISMATPEKDGNINQCRIAVIDITERKLAEEALRESEARRRTVIEAARDAIVSIDERGIVDLWNKGAETMFGYTEQEMAGKPLTAIIPERFRDNFSVGMQRSSSSGAFMAGTMLQVPGLKKDGTEFPTEVSVASGTKEGGIFYTAIVRDITERKKAEEELRQSEEKLRLMFESLSQGVTVTSLDGVIIEANEAKIRMHGYENKNEVIGRKVSELISLKDRDRAQQNRRKILEGGLISTMEFTYLTKEGKEFPVEVSSAMLRDSAGNPIGLITISENITERKRIEERLKATEQNFKNSMDDSPLGILIDTMDNEHLYANKALLDIYGFSSVEEFNAIPAGDRLTPVSNAEHQQRRKLRKEGKPVPSSYEMSIIRKDGEVRHLSASRKEVQWNGETQLQVVFQDITERKRGEETLRLQAELLDMEPDSVFLHDFDGNFIYLNRAFHVTRGYTREELLNMKLYHLDDPESAKQLTARRKEILEKGKSTFNISHRHKNGAWIPLEVHDSLIEIDGKTLIMSVARDISERRRLQEQLMAQDRLASIGQLVSGVAHEINNPLTSVIGFSDLLLQKELPADISNDIKIINNEAQRTAKIVRNLLTFARKQPGGKTETQINEQIQRVLDIRNHEQVVNNIQVNTQFAQELPLIMANSSQLQQVFFNLVINAEQAMLEAHNRGILTINTHQLDSVVRISFADDGPGISPENVSRLFTPFFTTKEVGKGTGLGLSICHGIITEHGGRIYAESEPGKGATFIIELPIVNH